MKKVLNPQTYLDHLNNQMVDDYIAAKTDAERLEVAHAINTAQMANLAIIPPHPVPPVFGSSTGNAVYFSGTLVNKYPRATGYYGIITAAYPARNYNQDAKYCVDVFLDGHYVDSIVTIWGDITDK